MNGLVRLAPARAEDAYAVKDNVSVLQGGIPSIGVQHALHADVQATDLS
jgi:hypothetical protein